MTDGFDVLVHEVIAAIATEPWCRCTSSPSMMTGTSPNLRVAGGATSVAVDISFSIGTFDSPSSCELLPAIADGGSLAGNDSSDCSS